MTTTTTTTPRENTVYIFAEGSASPKSSTGGWGAVLTYLRAGEAQPAAQLTLANRHEAATTHHRMALTGAIEALEALNKPNQHVVLVSGSKYLVEGISRVGEWKAAGWKTAGGKPVQNQDLWERLAGLLSQHRLGAVQHTEHRHCARASELAAQAREQAVRIREKQIFATGQRRTQPRRTRRASRTRQVRAS